MATIPKEKKRVFNSSEFNQFSLAIDKIAQTQFGAMQEPLTGDEMLQLFVPDEYRKGLKMVYEVEETSRARGEIWLNLLGIMPGDRHPVFEDPLAKATVSLALMRVYFHRDFCKDGFVTPTPLFGTRQTPCSTLAGRPPAELRERFLENAKLLLQLAAEWTMVRWAVHQLQNSLRTPQQMRYVWPATYTIAQSAGLKMDLSTPSARAGLNALPSPAVRPFLRETNDVVARSVLLGINEEYIARYSRKDIMITNVELQIEGASPVASSVNV